MKDIRLWGILILALALRALMLQAVFTDVPRARTPDSLDYFVLGAGLRSHRCFAGPYPLYDPSYLRSKAAYVFSWDTVWNEDPEIFRTPGYPAMLAVSQEIAGDDNHRFVYGLFARELEQAPDMGAIPASTGHMIVLSFQILLDLHLVLLTFFLGRALAGQGAGLLAALLQAISPLAAAASCRFLTDGVFAFMLTAAVLLLIRHFRTGGWWSLISAALVMGVSCYVRPVGLAFSAVMALVVLCSRRGTIVFPVTLPRGPSPGAPGLKGEGGPQGRVRVTDSVDAAESSPMLRTAARPRRLLRMAAFVSIVAACIAPWVVRNATVADYCGFSSFATDSMYWYSAAEIEARLQNKGFQTMREDFWDQEDYDMQVMSKENRNSGITPGDRARYRSARAREIIADHPWDFLDIHMRGNLAFWLPGAPDALEVLGYTSGGKGTLDVLHREGVIPATRHYFGDSSTAMALAGAMVVITLIRYLGVVLCGLWRLRLRSMSVAGWLCLLLVLAAFLLPGPANHPRFRVPIAPILSAAAAIGYIHLAQWRRRRA